MTTTIHEPDFNALIKTWLPVEEIEAGALEQLYNAAKHPEVGPVVAAMPDTHVGYGVTIGCVFPTVNAVLPNAVGVDIGCFTGDTKVPTLNGSSYSLKELHDDDEEVFVYACTPSGKVVAAKATVLQTRKSAPLVEVELDNSEKIRCTPDHRFMLRDGTYREAKDLQPETSLMPLYTKRDEEGYTRVQQNYSGRWQRAHWMVARSGLLGDIPDFFDQRTVIHHRDFNESNNLPTNLEFMGDRDHSKYHRSLVDRNTYWQSPEFETKRVAALSAKAKILEGHAFYATRGKRNILRYMTEHPEHFAAAVSGNGERGKGFLTSYNTSEKGRAKSKEIANRVYACNFCDEQIKSPIGLHMHKRKAHAESYTYNHKVLSVTPLTDTQDVYCLNVPEYHNFALDAGVFVHNCGMCAINTGIQYDRERMDKNFWRTWSGNVARNVPTGFTWHKDAQDLSALDRPLHATDIQPLIKDKAAFQLGTLGGGNHFLEAQYDEDGYIWLMVHSGSRHTGLRIANYYHQQAVGITHKRALVVGDDLASLPLDDQIGQDYLHDMVWATDFALAGRQQMIDKMAQAFYRATEAWDLPQNNRVDEDFINIHHNFAGLESFDGQDLMVHRKGATSAYKDQLGIIPGSMGTNSYIVKGLGNMESLQSCSHGAGRRMGRKAAKRELTEAQFATSLEGTYSKPSVTYIDEAPAAYKDIEIVIGRQTDLVEIVHTLKPIITVKGDSRAKED